MEWNKFNFNCLFYNLVLKMRTAYNHDTPGQVEGVHISCTGENETKTKLVPGEIR